MMDVNIWKECSNGQWRKALVIDAMASQKRRKSGFIGRISKYLIDGQPILV